MKKYDAIVIGSGQAGTPLVFKYASAKKRVAFVEKEHFGGTCLNVGCTPTKAYVASARRIFDVLNADKLGVDVPKGITADIIKIKERKDTLIKKSVDGMTAALEKNQYIDIFRGEAHFTSDKTIEVDGELITAEKIFINVGARARIPSEFEDVSYLTNEEMLELTDIPEHLIIIGGSYIGLEFGQMFRRFGSRITIIEQGERLIAREDEDVSEAIKEILEDEGIEFRMSSSCLEAIESTDNIVKVKVDCNGVTEDIAGSHLLIAVGRVPNTDTLNLKSTAILMDKGGYIKVNDELETDVEGVYALGDCNGKGAFTHTAYNDFEIVSANLFGDRKRKVSDRILTYALFIDPPLGRAGMTLYQAKKTVKNIKTADYQMTQVARAREKGETKGFMRIVIDGDSDKILGASFLGTGGDELASGILNVMYADKPYTLIRDSVQIHPTVSELIPTMLENVKAV
jgi:pyruvate/2-oxoglutarate dehydrogenase complex dihydrolipoamide dehydrogenase (E3) component